MGQTPFLASLDGEVTEISARGARSRVPYSEKLVGDPDTGVIAGGVVTTLLDHCCGQAAHAALDSFKYIATLDLRIDYMRAAEPGKDIFAKAHCFKVTRNVAFVRAVAYDDDPEDPVAAATAAFMLDSSAGKKPGANYKPPRSQS
jgi:uncharacterized protein (TIGR00369 family)